MRVFNAGKYKLPLGEKTYVMGILNVTPDSFSDGGKWNNKESALKHSLKMIEDGADIIDIGAQSTRPGHIEISVEEELDRLLPILEILHLEIDVPISVDTFYPEVAKEALSYGVSIINDVKGFSDDKMFDIMENFNCGSIIMHNGSNASMMKFFNNTVKKLTQRKINKNRVCFDPGIGFGKSYKENLWALKDLKNFKLKEFAMLVGASKKRVIGEPCENPPFSQRVSGTIAAHTIAIANGADIIRVHDVKEAVQAAKVADAILRS